MTHDLLLVANEVSHLPIYLVLYRHVGVYASSTLCFLTLMRFFIQVMEPEVLTVIYAS
jgi:hypothetical protein